MFRGMGIARFVPWLALLAACSTARVGPASTQYSEAALDARMPDGRRHASLMALAEDFEVPPGENIVVRELGRDSHVSHHMVAVRDREAPHRHDHSAMTVVVLKGRGRMMIEGEERPIGAGSIIYVPPATVHAYINAKGGALAIAYVMFSPPLRAGDRAPPTAPLPSAAVP